MTTTLLELTQHLADQVKLLNELDASKSGPLLNRVISRLAEKNAAAFNEVEQQKLCGMFRIEAKQLTDLLETCGYVFEQAAYNGAPSDALNRELGTVGMRAEWIDAFCAVWERNGAELRQRLTERSVCAKRLESIDWAMQMQLGQQDVTRIKKTNAVLSLTTRDQDDGGKRETINLEFTHDQLAAFSRQLDRIQEQMDALG